LFKKFAPEDVADEPEAEEEGMEGDGEEEEGGLLDAELE